MSEKTKEAACLLYIVIFQMLSCVSLRFIIITSAAFTAASSDPRSQRYILLSLYHLCIRNYMTIQHFYARVHFIKLLLVIGMEAISTVSSENMIAFVRLQAAKHKQRIK